MIIFGNVGRSDILARNLLLYTKKSFLQKIPFPLFRYHPPSQELTGILKFCKFCKFTELGFRGSDRIARERVVWPRSGSCPRESRHALSNNQFLRPEHFHLSGGAGRSERSALSVVDYAAIFWYIYCCPKRLSCP